MTVRGDITPIVYEGSTIGFRSTDGTVTAFKPAEIQHGYVQDTHARQH